MNSARPRTRRALSLGAALLLALGGAYAAYPERPVRIVLPVAPGAAADALARSLGARLAERLGQPVIVDSKPGANGIIATDFVAKSAPDGLTLLFSGNSVAVNPFLYRKLPFDTQRDLVPVALATEPGPLVLAASPKLGAGSVADVIKLAKARPGTVSYGSAGQGNTLHLAAALFAQKADIQLLHVPYKGAAPALTDLLAGQIDLMFNNLLAVKPLVEQGKLKLLAQTGATRMTALPDVPTLQEAGVPGSESVGWFALFAPAATPAAVLARLRQEIAWALDQPDVRERLAAIGVQAPTAAQLDMAQLWKAELARYRQLLQDMQLTLDTP